MATNPEIPKPCGTAMTLFTTEEDGSRKMIVQHRGTNNFFYGDIPGASVAGMWNGAWKVVDRDQVKLDDVDTDTGVTNIYREMKEEIGLVPDDMEKLSLTGFCMDKVKPHPEWIFEGVTNLTAEQVLERAKTAAKRERYVGSHNFAEGIFVLDGSLEAIDTLLTQVKTPLPPTHTAAFVASWYMRQMERVETGEITLEQAIDLKADLAKRIQDNYRQIDDLVTFYYRQYPGELENLRENQPRNPRGYTPAYPPDAQGLPNLRNELEEAGLIPPVPEQP